MGFVFLSLSVRPCALVCSQPSDKPEQGEEVHFQLLRMIRTLSRLTPSWLVKNRGVIDAVLALWRSPVKRLRYVVHLHCSAAPACIQHWCPRASCGGPVCAWNDPEGPQHWSFLSRNCRLFMDTDHALRNIQELKLTQKILVQYLRSTLLQSPNPSTGDIQGLFDLLLVFVTQRTGGECSCLRTDYPRAPCLCLVGLLPLARLIPPPPHVFPFHDCP